MLDLTPRRGEELGDRSWAFWSDRVGDMLVNTLDVWGQTSRSSAAEAAWGVLYDRLCLLDPLSATHDTEEP